MQQQQQQRKEGEPAPTTTVVDMNYDVNGSVIQLRQTLEDQQQSALVRGLTVTINQSRVAAWALFAFFAWGAMSELTKYMFRDAAAPLLVLWYVAGAIVVFVGLGALVLCFGRVRDAIVHMEERARGDNGYFKGWWGSIRRAILLGHRTSRVGGRPSRHPVTQESIDRSEYRKVECMVTTTTTTAVATRGQSGAPKPVSAAAAAVAPAAPSPFSPLPLAPAPLPPPHPPSSSLSPPPPTTTTRSFRSQLV